MVLGAEILYIYIGGCGFNSWRNYQFFRFLGFGWI